MGAGAAAALTIQGYASPGRHRRDEAPAPSVAAGVAYAEQLADAAARAQAEACERAGVAPVPPLLGALDPVARAADAVRVPTDERLVIRPRVGTAETLPLPRVGRLGAAAGLPAEVTGALVLDTDRATGEAP
ncbi:hypothetical protein JCM9533A_50290 [Catenuloplanes niger JCM 9533]